MAERAGADAIGVVVFSDSLREVSLKRAVEIFNAVGPFMARVCVSHTTSMDEINEIISLDPTAIQVSFPHLIPENTRVQVIRVIKPGDPVPLSADAVIVDESHGEGRLFDMRYALEIREKCNKPLILAGGLNPQNVAGAIKTIRPYAVDVASGVESEPGVKDPVKVYEFIKNAKVSDYET
jgi:phosphoribosylanthranilate isomerase